MCSGCRIRVFEVCLFIAVSATAEAASIYSPAGISVTVSATGSYAINVTSPAWQFAGGVGHPVSSIATGGGSDSIGPFAQITFAYTVDGPRRGTIRAYSNRKAVLFIDSYDSSAANGSPFPVLSQYPKLPYHVTFGGMFSVPSFPGWAPESPWFFWDASKNVFVVSPADHFMTAATNWDSQQRLVSGIDARITAFPSGFEHKTLLLLEEGINQAFDSWGHAMTDLYQKVRAPNDGDTTLRMLGYWTDNGASYYYRQAPNLSYEDTLTAVKAGFDQIGIQLGYMQLDSWFYPKGPNQDWKDLSDGIYLYEAAPDLFPDGLKAFQTKVGVPLVTHSRWIDATSPYRQEYQMSGNVVTDPLYWNNLAGYLRESGVILYEQDWLGLNASPVFDLNDADAFLGNMSASTGQQGLDMQYCMGTPRHFLQSLVLPNLSSVRSGQDRFGQTRWTNFLYSSRFAGALGLWPFTDVFMSGETQNLVLAVLSAGPVGVGDPLGSLSRNNLLSAVRPDGVIVKPDMPLTPVDASFFTHSGGDMTQPMVASTYSSFGDWKATYIVGYDQGTGAYPALQFSDFGLTAPGYLYDFLADTVVPVQPADAYPTPQNGFSYTILVATGRSGITMLGDYNQFAALGKQRIPAFLDDGSVHLTVAFSSGETERIVHGISPKAPRTTMRSGKFINSFYDQGTQRFMLTVGPGTDALAELDVSSDGTHIGRTCLGENCKVY
ncbi:MAG TPA: hypothetical protein VKG25_20745 [Bryobacteraceae bacterium]|nr:hypothetical protein [Bryobacteraceae bacterium]